jgi:uroporphyrin-3 C-methyltransferase
MSENDSSESVGALPPPEKISPPAPPRPPGARRGAGAFGWLLLILVVGAAGYGYWRLQGIEQGHEATVQSEAASAQKLRDEVDALRRSADAAKGEAQALRARQEDTAKVNDSLRAQVLGLAERTRLSEDAIANLADKRLSGHDALLLNEAELLLVIAQERYALFADPAPSLAAYKLADAALAQANDTAFASVRQSVEAEIAALGALDVQSASSLQGAIASLRESLTQLPTASRDDANALSGESRLSRIFGQFIRIRRDDESAGNSGRDDPLLARSLLDASLRDAQAALLIRDAARWSQSLALAKTQLAHDFDTASIDVTKAQVTLDKLAKADIAPPVPSVLGSALKELRNLRATHSLQTSAAGASEVPAPASPTPSAQTEKQP